jgi:hypothetical protein
MSAGCPKDEKLKLEEARKTKETTGMCEERVMAREEHLQQLFDRVAKLEAATCTCTCGKCQ